MNEKANLPALLLIGVGALLMWAALTNRNPLTVVKAVLQGQKIPAAGPKVGAPSVGSNTKEPNTSPFPSTPALPPAGGNPWTLSYQTPQGTVSV